MGIRILALTPRYATATMPVAGNRQPFGLLHGGAHLVLGESLASLCAAAWAGPAASAVGIEVSASHTGAASDGVVRGTCRAISLGRTLTVHEVLVVDASGRRLSTVRVTNLLRRDAGATADGPAGGPA